MDLTSTEASIYKTLAYSLRATPEAVKEFMQLYLSEYCGKESYRIDLNLLFSHFNISKNQINIVGTTLNHVTTRLVDSNGAAFEIYNLEHTLLTENPLTNFLRDNGIIFEKDTYLQVFYKGKELDFEKESWKTARLRNRLTRLNDSCINGFLFPDNMPYIYSFLTAMPEIVSDIFTFLDRLDLKKSYFDLKKCYVAVCYAPIEDIIFDGIGDGKQDIEEKIELLLKYVITYLSLKLSNEDFGFTNPIIRIPDNYDIDANNVLSVREVFSYKEIFKY